MTSEPDNTPRRPSRTIDLKATEVQGERSAAGQQSAGSDEAANGESATSQVDRAPGRRPRAPFVMVITGAAASAIGIIAAFWIEGDLPPRQPIASAAAPAATDAAIDDLAAQIAKLRDDIAAQKPDPALLAQLAAEETALKAQAETLAALSRRVDEATAAATNAIAQAKAASGAAAAATTAANKTAQAGVAPSDLDALASRVGALESEFKTISAATQTAASDSDLDALTDRVVALESEFKTVSAATQMAAPGSDLDALTDRVAALETAVKTLSGDAARQIASAGDRAARLTIAAEALRATVERGAPYQAELAAVQSLGADPATAAPLVPFAASGVPSAAALARELAVLMPRLELAANPAPGNNTIVQRLQADARALVQITPAQAPQGNDAASVAVRIRVDVAHDDIAAALDNIAKLPASAQPVTSAWVQKAQARNAALAAARSIAAAALAALAAPVQPASQ